MKPYLIDDLINRNTLSQSKVDKRWYTAKPVQYKGWLGVIQRFKHAIMVFRGTATAIQFKSDVE